MAYTFKHGDRPVEGYTIQRAVGKGGFGEVYYAVSDGGREVAIKYLRDNPQIELRGVSNCINLKSPHLVAIFDVKKTTDGEYAIIMEYCSGPSLRDLLIAEPSGFGPQKAAFFLREIAKGLGYLHDRGIVHRDLKPGNIFYDDGYVKIGDYGLSKFISVSRHSGQTASVGTVHYMAPEIGSGDYSKGVDIYALGVILYEMLLGKVPFEGSTMAEILMKHLTARPELDELPAPFGRVIRKALEKDPKERYASADEMVEELLEVEAVRASLAGFSVKSLEGAVRRGMGPQVDSPMPSPNPVPDFARDFAKPVAGAPGQPPFAAPLGPAVGFPDRLAKRMERISHKIEAKLAKLGGRKAPPKQPAPTPRPAPPPPPFAGGRMEGVGAVPAVGPSDRKKRIFFSLLLSFGLAVGLGVLMGNNISEEYGIASGFLVIMMSGGIILARGAARWFGLAAGPQWPRHLVQVCCCAPLMAMGAAPLFDHESEQGAAVWLGLLVTAMFFREGEHDRHGKDRVPGEISFGRALWTALWALIFTAIAGAFFGVLRVEHTIFTSAGVAGAASLIVQAATWWLPSSAARVTAMPTPDRHTPWPGHGGPPPPPPFVPAPDAGGYVPADAEAAGPSPVGEAYVHDASGAQAASHLRLRWGITRGFWGLAAFGLMGGAIVTFLVPLIATGVAHRDVTGSIIGCTACASFMLFALRKTGPVKREGFWRETVRPFLIAVAMSGIGATITLIAREWKCCSSSLGFDEAGRAASITGLSMCSLAFLWLLLFTGRRPRTPASPATSDEAGPGAAIAETPSGAAAAERKPADDGRRRRRALVRVFWGLVTFGFLCGANATFVIPLVGGFAYHDVTGSVIACTGFTAFVLFTLSKVTRFRREGFWRETLRPFLISLMLFGIGGTITGISREWGHHYTDPWRKAHIERVTEEGRLEKMVWLDASVPCVDDEGRVALVAGLVMCSVGFLWLLLLTSGKPRAPKPFVMGGSHGSDIPDGAASEVSSLDGRNGCAERGPFGAPGECGPAPARGDDYLSSRCEPACVAGPTPGWRNGTAAIGLAPHRGVTVLVLGILGINLFPLGIAAWVMGHHDLLDMEAGRMDPSGRGLTAAGRLCGMIGTLLAGVGLLVGLIVAAAAANGAFSCTGW